MQDMNIMAIKANDFEVFSHLPKEKRIKNIQTVKYIETLASQSGVDATGWDIFQMFGSGTPGEREVTTDRREINKTFFQVADKQTSEAERKEAAPLDNPKMQAELSDAAERAQEKLIARAIEATNSHIATYRKDLDQNLDRINEIVEDITNQKRVLAKLTGEDLNIANELMLVSEQGFFKIAKVEDTAIIFHTNRVSCGHQNKKAGVDLSVDMGEFKVVLNLDNNEVRVRSLHDNIPVEGHLHPHVAGAGSICWGNAGATAYEALEKFQYSKFFSLLASLLTHYSERNPYVHLEQFADKRDATLTRKVTAEESVSFHADYRRISRRLTTTERRALGIWLARKAGELDICTECRVNLVRIVDDEDTGNTSFVFKCYDARDHEDDHEERDRFEAGVTTDALKEGGLL